MTRRPAPAAGREANEGPVLPGGMTVARFLADHWQRKPLLVRGAFPDFADPLAKDEVLALAGDPDAESRLVRRDGRHWTCEHGPFEARRLARLPRKDWTVLVQDTNHFSDRADRLLSRFDFLPRARIDDLMVSFAVPGGGVGPHVDSYDVFIIQGLGRRRWQVSRQRDLDFVPGLDLRILARFEPEWDWVLEPGDMLYLPPDVAHHGTALEDSMNWSVGFRAPTDQELATGFLDHLAERACLDGRYADPGPAPVRCAGDIPESYVRHMAAAMERLRWDDAVVREFAGRYLSEPKPHVAFDPPARPLSRAAFEARGRANGVVLDRRAGLLSTRGLFFLNGETVDAPKGAGPWLRRLADRRRLGPGADAPPAVWDLLHAWHRDGVLRPAPKGNRP